MVHRTINHSNMHMSLWKQLVLLLLHLGAPCFNSFIFSFLLTSMKWVKDWTVVIGECAVHTKYVIILYTQSEAGKCEY